MSKRTTIKKDLSGLLQFVKNINTQYQTRIGILGANAATAREDGADGQTNSDIGFKHEFGVKGEGIPRRSFLMDPIQEKFQQAAVKSQGSFKKIAKQLDIKLIYKRMGILAEGIVQEAFETSGFGKWAPNSQRTIADKGSDKPLIDTAQLRKSITSDVKKQ